MREYLLLSAIMLVISTLRLWASSTMPFQLGSQGGVIVPVMLDGQGPFMMLLDTGASHSAIAEDTAAAIHARPVARSTVITATGETLRTIVAIDRVTIGPIAVVEVLPSVVPSRAFDENGHLHGLIGQDVLAWLRYTLDFRRRTVEWHDRTPDPLGTALPLTFEHGRFLVTLRQDHTALRLVPDSGAGALVLYELPGRRSLDVAETGRTAELRSAGGSRTGRHVQLRQLRLGNRTMHNIAAVAISRGRHHPAEGDGLLPLHLFDRVTFDGPSRLLILGGIPGPAS